MKTIKYNNKYYPHFQAEGNASQFAIPFAKHMCTGIGYDIGCNRLDWAFPGAIPIDLTFNNGYDAYNLPDKLVNYIYSSHCLEHLPNWIEALDYWTSKLQPGGILFLYLPHYSQEYWRPWNNRKHLHALSTELIREYMINSCYCNIFHSDRDMNDSFMIVGELKK